MNEALLAFYEDMGEQLGIMESTLLDMFETGIDGVDDRMINRVFRAMHTMKGNSGMFGFHDLVGFAHVAENLLDEVRKGAIPLTMEMAELLLLVNDHSRTLVEIAVNGETMDDEQAAYHRDLVDQLVSFLDGFPAETNSPGPALDSEKPAASSYRITVGLKDDFFSLGMDFGSIIKFLDVIGDVENLSTNHEMLPDVRQMDPLKAYLSMEFLYTTTEPRQEIINAFEFVKDSIDLSVTDLSGGGVKPGEPEPGEKTPRAVAGTDGERMKPAAPKSPAPDNPLTKNLSLRVDSAKVDLLINQISEMVITNAKIHQHAQDKDDSDLEEAVSAMSDLLEEVRNGIMNIRMVQVGDSFSKFRRIVSDAAKNLGKEIRFEIFGGDTELDKTVVEKISDPLVHMLRNAADHGIEPPEERIAAGKESKGKITLKAYPDAGTIVIEIKDDGRGLCRETLLTKAAEKGLVDAQSQLPDDAVYNLIFEPGFSTAQNVSDISGRGVGMDVVRRNIEELRGVITISSEKGAGTLISVRLPLTLAIIDGFLVQIGATKYIVPLDTVQECLELTREHKEEMKENAYINLRNTVLPLLDARKYFNVDPVGARRENIVVIASARQNVGLIVDGLYGEFQTVIKPLGDVFENISWLSGGTILGSGEVALILDIPMLLNSTDFNPQEVSKDAVQ